MNPIVRRGIILGTPLALGILDLFHPTISGSIFDTLSPQLTWWITLHIIQLPLFCLLALSVYLLLDGVKGTLATVSKVGLGIFVTFYPALDAILGIGTGALVSNTKGFGGGIQQAIATVSIESYFSDNVTHVIGILGSFGWAIALLFAALALSRPTGLRWPVVITAVLIALTLSYYQAASGNLIPVLLSAQNLARLMLLLALALGFLVRPHLAVALLVMAGFLLSEDHAPPFGPAAMACYLVAAIQLEFFPEKDTPAEHDVNPADDITPVAYDVAPAEGVVRVEQDVVSDPS
jgi:hypothetical protein